MHFTRPQKMHKTPFLVHGSATDVTPYHKHQYANNQQHGQLRFFPCRLCLGFRVHVDYIQAFLHVHYHDIMMSCGMLIHWKAE